MNLPNAITVARMGTAPLIGMLPFITSATIRFAAFGLFVVAAVSDYYDGHLARQRNAITDLGRLLDPLADKFLLAATIIPMAILMAPNENWVARLIDASGQAGAFPFVTPLGNVPLPWWIVMIIASREILVTLLRRKAVKRGHVISAIGPAKWKTAFQSMWVGAAFFWFGASTLAGSRQWDGHIAWKIFENINGIFGVLCMIGSVILALYSLWLYLRRYRHVLAN